MALDALEVSLALIQQLRKPLAKIAAADPDLARQLRRAVQSSSLNIAEGRERRGRDAAFHFNVALGSAAEGGAALRLAAAWGYVDDEEIAPVVALLDRVRAMLWRLARR